MNRRHRGDEYRRIVERVRTARPDIALSSDIVGFPGETDEDFEDTMRLVADIGFAGAFSFKYAPPAGTPAAELDGQVPEPVKAERLALRLQDLLDAAAGVQRRRPWAHRRCSSGEAGPASVAGKPRLASSRCRSKATRASSARSGGSDRAGGLQQPVRRTGGAGRSERGRLRMIEESD